VTDLFISATTSVKFYWFNNIVSDLSISGAGGNIDIKSSPVSTHQLLPSKPSIAVLDNSGTDEDSFDGDTLDDDDIDKDAIIYVYAHDAFIYRTVP
jgi:hypothetical protein